MWKFMEFLRKGYLGKEILIAQLVFGHWRVRHLVKRNYYINKNQIKTVMGNYQVYKHRGEISVYLRYRLKLPNTEA